MPVYNGEKYLDEAIQSILNQTYENFEFIIINDGSTDKSLEIIEKYKSQDERIVVISRENKGLIDSLNEGIEKSKGKYIARMDADDISLPTRFEKQIELMEKEDADICGCHWFIMNELGKSIDCSTVPLSNPSLLLYLSYSVPFAHGSVMIRKSFLEDNRLYYGSGYAKHAEDYDLWIKMFECGAKFVNVDDFLFRYRQFKQSLSQVNFKNNRSDAKKLGVAFVKKYKDISLSAFESLIENDLSRKEQELLIILGFRLSITMRQVQFFFRAMRKTDKKFLPNSLFKLLYVMVLD
jgi:glycosyltransferase involved in cell wall biosynthesis